MHPTDTAELDALAAEAFAVGVAKTRRNIRALADEPKSWAFDARGDYAAREEGFFDIGNWTSSFITGMAVLAWRSTRDNHFLEHLDRLGPWYRDKVGVHDRDTMHDLGFLYSLYSVALYKQTGGAGHREVGLRAAEVLTRRRRAGTFLQAWGRLDDPGSEFGGLAIIDCLMNLPLLYWAGQEAGDAASRETARRHVDTTFEYFIRADGSVYHAYRFDPGTGQPVRPDNYCGRSVESHWARGTAWAIYGFALSHRYTGEDRYLDAAVRVAHPFLDALGDAGVPPWDFRLPPGEEPVPDSSAAAIAVCGFQELLRYRPGEGRFAAAANRMLAELCSDRFLDRDPTCPGLLRYGQVGGADPGSAANAYTSWGDYFLMEALAGKLGHGETFW